MSYKLDLGSLTLGATFSIGDDDVGKALKSALGSGTESEDGQMSDKQLLKVLKDRTLAKLDGKGRARSASPGSRLRSAGSRVNSRANSRANSPRGPRRPRTTGSLVRSLSRLASPTRSSSPIKLEKPWEKMKEKEVGAELSGSLAARRVDLMATFDETFEGEDEGKQVGSEVGRATTSATTTTAPAVRLVEEGTGEEMVLFPAEEEEEGARWGSLGLTPRSCWSLPRVGTRAHLLPRWHQEEETRVRLHPRKRRAKARRVSRR